jgi:3-phenylpropionate/trans-cinnamate dioxygenase ferredoxin reductase subunit
VTTFGRIAVVGASLAGVRAAETLRASGHQGRLTLISAEPEMPYDRPPLSKQLLTGEWDTERVWLRKPDHYSALDCHLLLGRRAVSLDPVRRTLRLDDDIDVEFDGLIVATGAEPRRLPATPSLPGIRYLRTLPDALALRSSVEHDGRVVVIGAGFIGLEAAARSQRRGAQVAVVESATRPLERVLGPRASALVAQLHADNGVDLRCSTAVSHIEGDSDVTGVRLTDGTLLATKTVLVGIGAAPSTAWLADSGLHVADGVMCDAYCAAAPGIYAAGDVARWYSTSLGAHVRHEHWTNAVEQARRAAQNMLLDPGEQVPYDPVPYVWSDQYDIRIQVLGHWLPDDDVRVLEEDTRARRLVELRGRLGRVTGALTINAPREFLRLKRLVNAATEWSSAAERTPA